MPTSDRDKNVHIVRDGVTIRIGRFRYRHRHTYRYRYMYMNMYMHRHTYKYCVRTWIAYAANNAAPALVNTMVRKTPGHRCIRKWWLLYPTSNPPNIFQIKFSVQQSEHDTVTHTEIQIHVRVHTLTHTHSQTLVHTHTHMHRLTRTQ